MTEDAERLIFVVEQLCTSCCKERKFVPKDGKLSNKSIFLNLPITKQSK